jgi:hypothetical protein
MGDGWRMLSVPDENTLLVFMDECGDHSTGGIDPHFPILLLAFVLAEKDRYSSEIIPAVGRLKLQFWPHEGVNLHSRDIRKQLGDFSQFHQEPDRLRLMQAIADLIRTAPFELVVSCVHKSEVIENPDYLPYHKALRDGLREVSLHAKLLAKNSITLIAEARGKREDRELVAWLTAQGASVDGIVVRLVIRAKRDNIAGLQVADLCAYPAARHIIKPRANNPAFEIVRGHLVGWVENKKGGDA